MGGAFTEEAFWEAFGALGEGSAGLLERGAVEIHAHLDSTNSELLRRLRTRPARELHKTIVAAESQSAGRGRTGRTFHSPAGGGIYFSLAYAPPEGIRDPADCTVAAAVGICRAISALYHAEPLIKWVNDLYLGRKKICGILTEGTCAPGGAVEAAVIGMGINQRMGALPADGSAGNAGGIEDVLCRTGEGISRARLLARAAYEILRILAGEERASVMEEYRRRSLLTGKTVTVSPLAGQDGGAYRATVLGITDDAALLVRLADGTERALRSGEVTLHGLAP